MYIVREVFIAKPGSAGKLAKMMKEAMAIMDPTAKVLLDFVTDFNKIVIEHEVKSLADFENEMTNYKKEPDQKLMEIMKNYTDLYQTGYREIFKVVE